MKVLLVEDNLGKRAAISKFLSKKFPEDVLEEADSLIVGLRLARDHRPDFILLDMSLPNHPSKNRGAHAADMRPFAGTEFLRRVKRMKFPTKVLIVSMFETFGVAPNLTTLQGLSQDMAEKYPEIYLSAIHYSTSDDEWQVQVKKFHQIVKAGQ
ncbi:Response regulator of citrate/malate metabolism [Phaeobacter piscinae]|uniref:Response regulator of citrate/malate metabolism n=1 Tax=Phaeobacter piscinae TaxID=1580596 RepID=A0ABM6PG33_9RHOB|nr:response regulator transcription factor [Phaeobacter piscinae]ATG36761.1 Response regulator of citrate/malate metabolism [Phaeobacter piscinae]AUQ87282.1 Response regulator of citrate/malate metabolism [Phaeobacter piscinae]AUR25165.1 Response regulator of citrate/malate metabolism [Phaeobacter piscinae]